MRESITAVKEWMYRAKYNVPRWFLCLSIVLMVIVAPVGAQQFEVTLSDDFEDGDIDGWDGQFANATQESYHGQYSLAQSDGYGEFADRAIWTSGPTLNLSESFTVKGTVKSDQGVGGGRTRLGLINDNDRGAMLIFSEEFGATFLDDVGSGQQQAPADAINTSYNNVWVNFIITSPDNETALKAKVWPVDEQEPSDYQLSVEFDPQVSPFSINPGADEGERVMYLDNVTVSGSEASDPDLSIDARNYMRHNTTQEYRVFEERNTTGVANFSADVTNNSTVESLNPSVISVNQQTNELVATSNKTTNERVTIRAEYNGSVAYKEITVASPTVDNLAVLPPMWRISATFGDSTIQAILVAIFAGIFGARVSTSFGGLALMQLMMVAGWFTGYATVGITMISLFAALFIGLNMAANIDYTVRQ